MLGGARVFPVVVRILRLPPEPLDPFLGEALSDPIKPVVIGFYSDQAEAALSCENDVGD